jgi:hypothetical protein
LGTSEIDRESRIARTRMTAITIQPVKSDEEIVGSNVTRLWWSIGVLGSRSKATCGIGSSKFALIASAG